MFTRRSFESARVAFAALAGFLIFAAVGARGQGGVMLRLKSGDRISGIITSEDTNRVVLSNSWAPAITIPLNQIVRREKVKLLPGSSITNVVKVKAPPPPPKKEWSGELQAGTDLRYGANEGNIVYGRLKLNYQQPYKWNSKKFFKNFFDYSVEYGKTEDVVSSDKMYGSDKTAFDVGRRIYVYNLMGVGYDHVLKIDLNFEAGPGLGYHLFSTPVLTTDLEFGMNYQATYQSDNRNLQDFFYRLADNVGWKITKRLSLTEKFEYFPRVNLTNFRIRFENTLSYLLWKNISANFSILDFYDTQPAPGIENNELELRSTIGLKF
jgi:putative salt-induced outer membrane protein YdiY